MPISLFTRLPTKIEGDDVLYMFIREPMPAAARSEAWVSGRSLAGIVGSNPSREMDVYLL
jgi:hypothetical protein